MELIYLCFCLALQMVLIANDNPIDALPSKNDKTLLAEIQESNKRCEGKIEIRRALEGKGWGVFALRRYEPNELVIETKPIETSETPTSHTIQVDWNKHVEISLPGRFLNHFCGEPNLYVKLNDGQTSYNFYAKQCIEINEEVNFDYETSEYKMAGTFDCECGSSSCRGKLTGFHYHKAQILESFKNCFLAPYLLQNEEALLAEIQESNKRCKGKIEIRRALQGKGWGVFALQQYEPNELVIETEPIETSQDPTGHTIQVDWNKHVEINLPGRFLNHFCGEPNLYVKLNDTHTSYNFYAKRCIMIDEEVNFDYETSEYKMAGTFDCECGSASCRGKLTGFYYHQDQIKKNFKDCFLAPYLLEKKTL